MQNALQAGIMPPLIWCSTPGCHRPAIITLGGYRQGSCLNGSSHIACSTDVSALPKYRIEYPWRHEDNVLLPGGYKKITC